MVSGNGPAPPRGDVYRFAGYTLSLNPAALFGPRGRTDLSGKPLCVLLQLVKNARCVVADEDMQRICWPGVHRDKDAVKRCIHRIKAALGEEKHRIERGSVVRTLLKGGYKLEAVVEHDPPSPIEPLPPNPDAQNVLKQLCKEWCALLWLPQEVTGSGFRSRGEFSPLEIELAKRIAQAATTKPFVVPAGSGIVGIEPEVMTPADVLWNMAQLLSTHTRPGFNLIRHYTFDVVLRRFKNPNHMFYDISTFAYHSSLPQIREVLGGRLSLDEKDVDTCNALREFVVNSHFNDGARWSWSDMREAEPDEVMHMRMVMDKLSDDLSTIVRPDGTTYKAHLRSFRDACDDVRTHGCRDERQVGHLVACTICAGVPRLMAQIGSNPKLHVPACFRRI